MVVIIGLGNPGRDYISTRHNIGYLVVEALAGRLKCVLRAGKGEYRAGTSSFRDDDVVIAKPVTSMNESGIAVAQIVEQYQITLSQVLVVFDDFQLPLGILRMRPSGTDGGHNGMYSIIYHLQSDTFPRLRCGIGSDDMPQDKSMMADFVLSRFSAKENSLVDEMVQRAVEACLSFASDGIEKAMSLFNRKIE